MLVLLKSTLETTNNIKNKLLNNFKGGDPNIGVLNIPIDGEN